jgi:hypothetical protein
MDDSDFAHLCKTSKSVRGLLPQAAILALLCASLTTFTNTAFAQEGTFVHTGSMSTARGLHKATLLNNGMVLVAGGYNGSNALATAELYDPTTGTLTPTGSMNTARLDFTATLLNNGTVLVTGGLSSGSGNTGLLSAELYDPTTGTFTLTGSMNTARLQHTATLLNNGKVLVAGGVTTLGSFTASAELYDPATGTFAVTGSMSIGRDVHTATLLSNGMVLVAGGLTALGSTATAELYNPTTGTFGLTGSLNTDRNQHTATLLNTGNVLVAGGTVAATKSPTIGAELYNLATGTFAPTGSMTDARTAYTASLLNNGKVIVAGGCCYLASAELYDPTTGTFTITGSMSTARVYPTGTVLKNGTVLVAGSWDGNSALATTELYEPVVVSPTSLSFSGQVVGTTSASQPVTLTNNESTALSITGVVFSGTNATDFSETDNCVGSVAAGTSCTIHVTFTPAALGSRAGSLTIANNLSGNPVPIPPLSLAGTGVTATQIISLSTSSLTFTNQLVGSSSPAQGITLTGTGNSTLTISGLVFSGTNASEFAETDNCVGKVPAGASCTINVTFSPTATGTRTGTLSITDNATSPPSPQTVTLTGTATAPSVSVTPSSIAFPAQYVGTSGLPQSVTVTNNGNAPSALRA